VIAFALGELVDTLDARLHGGDAQVASVSTDTRTLNPGDLFVALVGPNFDGHDYLAMAADRGACAALVARRVECGLPLLEVGDTRRALGRLARAWRQRAGARVIGLTGSNGKTTLKEMLASILAQVGSVMATRGNLNNDIGVPLTLTRLQDESFAVIEMGANHAGEIDYLTRITCPDIAVLNNAGRAHLEGFGSLEGVARAKGEIINGIRPGGVFVLNADDRFAPLWRGFAGNHEILSFGVDRPADVHSPREVVEVAWTDAGFSSCFPVQTPDGEFDVALRLAGHHNRMNALAAAAAALAAGADGTAIAAGLAALAPVRGRLCPVRGRAGVRLVDDSYNANPDSVAAALGVLGAAPGRRTLVLGDLAELGDDDARLHAEIGELARAAGIHRLLTCGERSAAASRAFGANGRHFDGQQALIDFLLADAGGEDSILVKGSRSARMERVVNALAEEVPAC
jgi:UDP-N-acetylmuramoyl-tripeptide--D-alanyl-D-alanine ligase